MKDRTKIARNLLKKSTLQEQDDRGIISDASPAERIAMVWQMTIDTWAFMDPESAQSEFQRHVVRVERRRS